MLIRQLIGCLTLALVTTVGTLAEAAEQSVFLQGHYVTQDHVVFGTLDQVSGSRGALNLGYAHGVEIGQNMLVVRSVSGAVIPVSGLTVIRVEPGRAHVRVEGPFRARQGDFVLIPAKHLDLWDGQTRQTQLIKKRIVQRKRGRGYNTLSPDPNLWNELGRDDSYHRRQYIAYDWGAFLAEAERNTEPGDSLAGSVEPMTVLNDADLANEEATSRGRRALHIEILGLFLTAAKTEEAIISRLENDRLFRIDLMESGKLVTEETAPLYRRLLVNWTEKVLGKMNPPVLIDNSSETADATSS